MWSDSNRDYVKQLVLTNREEYPYYVAHTCTYWDVTNSSSLPAFKVYFSKEPIIASSLYDYKISANSLCYSVVSSNANKNYHNMRVTATAYSGNLSINEYEFIYSNAEYSAVTVQPDVTVTDSVSRADYQGVNFIIIAVLLGVIVYKLIRGR